MNVWPISVCSVSFHCRSGVLWMDNIFLQLLTLLLAHLESAYSLIWGSHKIWSKGGGEPLVLL